MAKMSRDTLIPLSRIVHSKVQMNQICSHPMKRRNTVVFSVGPSSTTLGQHLANTVSMPWVQIQNYLYNITLFNRHFRPQKSELEYDYRPNA